jgi:saxitoxin biosynthesis operon SxtJ-like protein
MAIVLLVLLGAYWSRRDGLVMAAMIVHVVNMTVPQAFRPLAVVWLGASHAIGMVMSTVLLSIVFALVVTPVGLFRRLTGKDTLRLRAFKASDASVMMSRNHLFEAHDLERPY